MLTQSRLKELLHYDPETGLFTNRVQRGSQALKGAVVGSLGSDGYLHTQIEGSIYTLSRLAWLYVRGHFPEFELDHIKRVRTDNRIKNLRNITSQGNHWNTMNPCNNTSGVKGVYWNNSRSKYQAQIKTGYKNYGLGQYNDFTEAVCTRLAAEQCLGWESYNSATVAFQYVQQYLKEKRNA